MSESELDTNINDTSPQATTQTYNTDWFITESIPGSGERPEWLESKYKSVESQAKAYKEARKQLGAMSGAPESYNLDPYKDFLDVENAHLKDFLSYAKENRISQDAVERTVKSFIDYSQDFVEDEDAQKDAILKQYGEEHLQRIDTWAQNTLSPEAREALSRLNITGELVSILDDLRTKSSEPRLPVGQQAQSHVPRAQSVEDVKQELRDNYAKYESNPSYRSDLEARLARAMNG